MDDLIKRLRDGIPACGQISFDIELYDTDAAETTMAEAADEIERLRAQLNEMDSELWNARFYE